MAVPFESLDISLGRPIRLDLGSCSRRSSTPAAAATATSSTASSPLLLRSLGYAVDLVSARVATAAGGLTDDFDHLALVVTSPAARGPVLADVGFGDGFIEPLPLRDGSNAASAARTSASCGAATTGHSRERR